MNDDDNEDDDNDDDGDEVCTCSYFSASRDERSLAIAKKNLKRHYRVVALHENMRSFFKVLEALWPHMFQKALKTYDEMGKSHRHRPVQVLMQFVNNTWLT